MNSYAREFIFVLAVAFTAIAALQNGPLKSRKTNPPSIFFSEPSLVTDFYQGEAGSLRALVSEKDVSLVMYYAPWDAESMHVREEYENAAKFYHNEVFFAAINCWWPEGECGRRYKIESFPLLVLYVYDVGGVRYDGPLVANYIIAFLDHALAPLVTLQHTGELLDLQTKHEGVLVAYFNFKNGVQPAGYIHFYSGALKALTQDPYRKLCFAVITNEKARLKFKMKSTIQLYLWNKTEVYKDRILSSTEMLNWAYGKLNQVSQWITPPRLKSNMLSEIIEKTATLIMFTPRNMLLETSPYYDLFREVALDYNNCNRSDQVTPLVHRIVLRRHILQEALSKLIQTCHLSDSDETLDICEQNLNKCDLTCCQTSSLDLGPHGALQCFCRICLHHTVHAPSKMKLSECENTLELVLKSFEASLLHVQDECSLIETAYPTKFGSYNRLSFKCYSEPDKVYSKTSGDIDMVVEHPSDVKDDHVLTLIKSLQRNRCGRLRLAHRYSDLNFPEFPVSEKTNWQVNFTGLGCRTNRTLFFMAMDTMQFHSFAESLGVDVLNKHHQTAVLIVEAKQENLYLLDDNVNKKTLVEFVRNYSAGSLNRYLRSSVNRLQVSEGCSEEGDGVICVRELTTATFMDFVLDNETDVVLMYYAPWCGACSAVFHVFLAVSNYFSRIQKIKFARISGDDNDLPWEYTVEKYPTIMFFPAFRKSESIEYPAKLPITTPNLLRFVLVNSQPKVRWVITMRMCNRECVANNLARSSTEIRHLFRDHHNLLNQLHYVRQLVSKKESPKKSKFVRFTKSKTATRKAESEEWWRNYMKYLISRIRIKRSKIRQAFELLDLLKKKRDYYLKSGVSSSSDASSDWYEEYRTSWDDKVVPVEEKTSPSNQRFKDEL